MTRRKPCAVDGCNRLSITRGWCDKHYRRWKAHGDPQYLAKKGPVPQPPLDRILIKATESEDGCWLYQGTLQQNGYGAVYLPQPIDGHRRAHRVTYEFFITEIPDGLEIDHLCNQRNCVNPWHMEPVTHAENMRRAFPRLAS